MITREMAEVKLREMLANLPPRFVEMVRHIEFMGGKPQIVGGVIPRTLLGRPMKDVDVEVFGLEPDKLFTCLQERCADVRWQGKTFGVIVAETADDEEYEVALPRWERRIPGTTGPRDFEVGIAPDMSRYEAARRRDYTINAMSIDPLTGEFFDLHGGLQDLNDGILRPVSERFAEDPERVIKGARHAAELGFRLTEEEGARAMLRGISSQHANILPERLQKDWMKIFEADRPGDALIFLRDAGWLENYPEFNNLIGLKQTPIWHGEEDAFIHTVLVANAAPQMVWRNALGKEEGMAVRIAALLHDIGKHLTTEYSEKMGVWDWRSPGHAHVGAEMVPAAMARMNAPARYIQAVVALTEMHMVHMDFGGREVTRVHAERIAVSLGAASHRMLKALCDADHMGRGDKSELAQTAQALFDAAVKWGVADKPPVYFITGDMIMPYYGGKGGKHVKTWKDRAYEAQIDGAFYTLEDGQKWLDRQIQKELRLLGGDFIVTLFGGKSGKHVQEVLDELWQAQLKGEILNEDQAKARARQIVRRMSAVFTI